jgi:hypothetical protein
MKDSMRRHREEVFIVRTANQAKLRVTMANLCP